MDLWARTLMLSPGERVAFWALVCLALPFGVALSAGLLLFAAAVFVLHMVMVGLSICATAIVLASRWVRRHVTFAALHGIENFARELAARPKKVTPLT